MRTSEAALALITRVNPHGELEYLLQWNEKWQGFSLIGGHREAGESFRDCCIREIEEELGLERDVHFEVSNLPDLPIIEYIAFSRSAGVETRYRIELFAVTLQVAEAEPLINGNRNNRWAGELEICDQHVDDDRPIAEQVKTVLTLSNRLRRVPDCAVEFSGRVRDELQDTIRGQLGSDLSRVFRESGSVPTIFVPRLFAGYTPDYAQKIVLAVEVTCHDRYERHIVKIGRRNKVASDFVGWQECTRGRMVASRIFAPVRMVDLDDNRVAVVYRDAYSLFGPEDSQSTDSAPKLLEEAIEWAVNGNDPDPLSVQRAISHVFTDLGVWFYRGASDQPELAWKFYSRHLTARDVDSPKNGTLERWEQDQRRAELRRHAVWVLSGRDPADADPETKPARYLDPVDYIRWSMQSPDGHRIPRTLVGRTHGDLHARNILVGIRRGEVQYPAVFDYGDMQPNNVLAWDFAKLETELKVRLLTSLVHDEATLNWLVRKGKSQQMSTVSEVVPSANARRATRMAAFLAFEELLDEATTRIEDEHSVDRVLPLVPRPTGCHMLDRLVEIVFRIRQEAAYWLGFKSARRHTLWKDELYFALGVYGLLNVRWDYSGPEQEAALISAGVAIARMPSVPKKLKTALNAGIQADDVYPSYRVSLAICFQNWKRKEYKRGCQFVEGHVLNLMRDDRNVLTKIEVLPGIQHAVPLVGQALLLQLEVENLHAVEPILERMRDEARTFHDSETLAKVGRVYKEAADRKWDSEIQSAVTERADRRTRAPSLQMYDKSFNVYSEAYELTGDLYVGINAATLALLTGKRGLAEQYAREIAEKCASKLDYEKKDHYWLFAMQGEAAIILNEPSDRFYESAINEASQDQVGMVDSSYRQIVRLWRYLDGNDDRRIEPVLVLFEMSPFRQFLSCDFLGRIATDK